VHTSIDVAHIFCEVVLGHGWSRREGKWLIVMLLPLSLQLLSTPLLLACHAQSCPPVLKAHPLARLWLFVPICAHFWLLGLACPRSDPCGLALAHLGLLWLAWACVGLVLAGAYHLSSIGPCGLGTP
jgi:hypothetical protein